jgi:hypothetical protein
MAPRYSDEFRLDAVRIATTSGLTRPQIASDLGVGVSTLNKWVQKYLNRPGFTGEHFVQNLRCFFKGVQVFVESFLRFSWREISDSTVDAFCVVPIDPFQRFPFQLANGFPGAE